MILPRLGDHHHDGMRQRAAGHNQHLEAIVEHGRIATVGVDHGQDFFNVISEKIGLEHRLPRVHPVNVAAQGVDLAVMRDVAIRMAAVPTWKGISAEARMNEREGTFHRGMPQVGIIQVDLLGHEHAFVDQRLVREA